MLNIYHILLTLSDVALQAVESRYDWLTLGPDAEYDTYHYTVATFNSLKDLDHWNFEALETINRNIVTQHSEMREHLQDRHQDMATDIVEFIEESTNTVAGYFTLQSDWLYENLCSIHQEIADVDTCEGDTDTLLGLVGLSLWGKMIQIEVQGETVMEKIEIMSSSLHDVSKEVGLKLISSDANGEGNVNKVDSMKVNMESMKDMTESKMESMKDTIENSMESMKHKVDTIENNMESMKRKMDKVSDSVIKLTEQLSKNYDKK